MPDFSVLVVCTANLCRSPAAAALLAAGLPPGSALSVTSAGTSAALGEQAPQPLARALAKRGIDVSGHRPRQLTAELVDAAGLVLVATRAHRSTVVGAVPGAVRRTFTLRELARLLHAPQRPRWAAVDATDTPSAVTLPVGGDEVARWAALGPLAAASRGVAVDGAEDDLADPYRRSSRAYRASVEQIALATSSILAAVDARAPGAAAIATTSAPVPPAPAPAPAPAGASTSRPC